MERIPSSFTQAPIFERLGNAARVANLSEPERRAYDRSLKIYWDNYAIEKAQTTRAQQQYVKGRAEGRTEGRAEGRAEGLAEGSLKTLKNLVASMKANGLDQESIAKITGLTTKELKTL